MVKTFLFYNELSDRFIQKRDLFGRIKLEVCVTCDEVWSLEFFFVVDGSKGTDEVKYLFSEVLTVLIHLLRTVH